MSAVMVEARPFAIGEWVRVVGSQGVFKVMGWAKDGSAWLYGGDPNPLGRRGSRAVMPDRLKPAKAPAVSNENVPSPILRRRASRTRKVKR